MRIEPPDKNIDQNKDSAKVRRKKLRKSVGKDTSLEETWEGFMDVLDDIQLEKAEEEAKKYLQLVLSSGNRFSRSPTHRHFLDYKESMRKFLQFIEKGLYRIREDAGMDVDFPKLYMIAEVVDEKMHQVAQLLINNEKNTIVFAAKVEEMNGLIIDLYR